MEELFLLELREFLIGKEVNNKEVIKLKISEKYSEYKSVASYNLGHGNIISSENDFSIAVVFESDKGNLPIIVEADRESNDDNFKISVVDYIE